MKVKILTGAFGEGHRSAAFAVAEKLNMQRQDGDVEVVDIVEELFPRAHSRVYKIFQFLVNRCAKAYNLYCDITENKHNKRLSKYIYKQMEKYLDRVKPDMVIVTVPIAAQYVGIYKRNRNRSILLYTYITDIEVRDEWLALETDGYFVASAEVKEALLGKQVCEKEIYVSGIPVKQAFVEMKANEPVLKKEHVNEPVLKKEYINEPVLKKEYINEPVLKKEHVNKPSKKQAFVEMKANPFCKTEIENVLIMGGGLGMIPGWKSLIDVLIQNKDIKLTVIAGRNRGLYEQIKESYPQITTVGYTEHVAKYMKNADLIISKAGGITTFETIASETPICVITPFLSQEVDNAKFIERHKMGVVIWNEEDCRKRVIDLINHPERLCKMQQYMRIFKASLYDITPFDLYYEERGKEELKCIS